MDTAVWELAKRAFHIESESILQTVQALDAGAFGKAVDALASAGKVGTSGCGHSGIACMHFAHSLCCIEKPARFLSPSEAVHGASGFLGVGDVLVLASRGGQTAELLPIADICHGKGGTVIGIMENPHSPLGEKSDIILGIRVLRECDRHDSQGTTSFAVMNALFDALQTALVEVLAFSNDRFAHIHPGGAVGLRLNRKEKA